MLINLAQVEVPTDPPTTVAATLFLVIVLLLTGWLHTRGDYQEQKQRADRYEQALQEERKAVLLLTETVHELKQLGVLMRAVLESLPQPDEPPRTPPRRRTS